MALRKPALLLGERQIGNRLDPLLRNRCVFVEVGHLGSEPASQINRVDPDQSRR
jgi:hypothetical protein